VHGIPLFAPLLHFSFAGEDATQPANGALVGVKILSGHGATLPATQFWIQWMNYLHIRVTLLKPERPKACDVRKWASQLIAVPRLKHRFMRP
jgi:hypothetical protein